MKNELCERCLEGGSGETGHELMRFYVGGPYPGQSIFKCSQCGERWIRHYGGVEKFAWTRYAAQFPDGIRTPRFEPKRQALPR